MSAKMKLAIHLTPGDLIRPDKKEAAQMVLDVQPLIFGLIVGVKIRSLYDSSEETIILHWRSMHRLYKIHERFC